MIDYEQIIDRDNLDLVAYEEKFKKVDEWLLGDRTDTKAYASFLMDETLFSYLHFRLNGKLLKYYPYQDLIAQDNHRFKYFRSANQTGKSLKLDAGAARNLIIDHGKGHNEAIVSKSLPQSTFQMRRVKSLLKTMPEIRWEDVPSESDSLSVISVDIKDEKGKTKYTNYLICAPCTEGLLGYDLDHLSLDEYEFWEVDIAHFFNQIAQPRTYATKGSITIFTNPNGQNNFGAELEEQRNLDGKRKWHVYCFNFLDRPGNTQEEYDQLKAELPRAVFESTVAAIRSISSRNFFTPDEIERSYDKNLKELDMVGKQPFFFLDVGSKHDQSVLVGGYVDYEKEEDFPHIYIPIIHAYPVGYPITRVVGAEVDNSDGWHYEKSVKEHLEEWKVGGIEPSFGVDVTGNSGISPLFDSIGISACDVVFSGPSKSGMYQRFKYFMEKGLLHRIKHKDFEKQAGTLIMEKSKRGYLMVHHEREDDLDDCMDSLAGLLFLADPAGPGITTPSVKMF